MDVTLAKATREDLPRLFEWMRGLRCVGQMAAEQFIPLDQADGAMSRLIDDPSAGRVWIIRADKADVGYAVMVFSFSVEFGGRTAFIDELYTVCEGHTRQAAFTAAPDNPHG